MKFLTLLLSCFLMAAVPKPVYAAVASASDAEKIFDEDIEDEELEADAQDIELENDLEVNEDGDVLATILSEVTAIRDVVAPADLASASDASVVALEDSEMDPDGDGSVEDVFTFDPVAGFSFSQDFYYNALRFDAVINGESVVLLFPPEHIDSLYIDSQDRLFNLSTSSIYGRIVGDSFDPYATEGRLVYLTPCLGNNFSSIYNYGSPNYVRDYYWSGSRLTYTDTYVEIQVTDYHYPFRVSETMLYVILFLLGGGVLLLWLRNYRHY